MSKNLSADALNLFLLNIRGFTDAFLRETLHANLPPAGRNERALVDAIRDEVARRDYIAADVRACNGIGDVTHAFLPAHSH